MNGDNEGKRVQHGVPSVGPFGDVAIADVFECVVYWLNADRNTLDALSHACAATRRHLVHSPNFVDAVFVCPRGCHVRCYTPRRQLTVACVKFEALWRLRESIHNLQRLSLSDLAINDDELAALLSCCSNLTELDLNYCRYLTSGCMTAMSRCPITSLKVRGCNGIFDLGLKEISRCSFHNLQQLFLRDLFITDAELAALLSCCPDVTELRTCNCKQLTDACMTAISQCLITSIDLSGCDQISDLGLKKIARCPISTVSLCACTAITNNGLKEISRCPIRAVNLFACTAISDSGLKEISRCPLTALNLRNCINISDSGLEEISCCLALQSATTG